MPLDLRLALPDDGQLAGQAVNIKCPEHKDKVASLSVYPGNIHCNGCRFHLVGYQALAYLLKVSLEEAVAQAPRYTTESLDAYRERAAEQARKDPLPVAIAEAYNCLLTGHNSPRVRRQEWFYDRGLTFGSIETFLLGHDGWRFTIPIFESDGALVSIRYRRDDEYGTTGPKYSGIKGRNGFYVMPLPQLAVDKRDWVVLVEGELDAIRMWQEGWPAVSSTNGAGQVVKLPAYLKEHFPRIKRLLIATDRDEAGNWAAEATRTAALDLGYQVWRLAWAEGKDVTEALAAGCRLHKEAMAHAA